MGFEYDRKKSAANKRKHGIDFDEAQVLWKDHNRVILPARDEKEPRHLMIAVMDGVHWTAIATFRDENIRLISVRRSRMQEVEFYENQIQKKDDRFNA